MDTIAPFSDLLSSVAYDGPSLVAIIRYPDTKLIFVNRQFEHYFGLSNIDLGNNDILFRNLIEDYLIDRFLFQLNITDNDIPARSRFIIYPLQTKSGERIPFNLYASPTKTELGEPAYHLVMHPDLSKWNLPFNSFNTRELFLEQFANEDFGTFEWLVDSDKLFWSKGLYRIYEIDENNISITRAFVQRFTHPNDRERVQQKTQEALDRDTVINIEFRIITPSNKVKVIHSLGRLVKYSRNLPAKFVGSVRDVTEQHNIEKDLQNKVEELHHSNKELEEFAFVASHDLQEPLRKITTFSDRLSEKYKDVLTGDGLMYLSRMIASAENMRSLINDLLEFSRITKTQQPFESVNLNLVLKQVRTDLELTIEETGTQLNSHSLPQVHAIFSQMKQLFTNIIGNAIKFRKPGVAPVINIENHRLSDDEKHRFELTQPGAYYKITISDNGIGFEEEYTTRIFQVFQRLHGKSEYPGSGIGLAICKKILEYHHGVIFAENVPGVGARFTFILPEQQEKTKDISA